MQRNASQVYTILTFLKTLASTTMFTTYALYFIKTLEFSPFQLLLVGMVLESTCLVFEGITGVVADTYSRRLSVIVGTFILGIGFVLEGGVIWLDTLTPFYWILLAEVILGIGYTFISGADTAWIVDEVGEQQVGRVFMRAKKFALIATLVGIALSVALSTLAPNLPYLMGGFLYLATGLFLVIAMKETAFIRRERTGHHSHWGEMKQTWLEGAGVIRRQPVLVLVLLVTLFSGAASEGYDRLWEAQLITGVGIPTDGLMTDAMWFGVIAILSTLLSIIVMQLTEKRLDLGDERVVVRGMFVLTAIRIIALFAFAFAPGFAWAFLALLIIGVVRTMSEPMYDTWLNLHLESKVRATVLSMMNQSDALGQIGGGPLVGWVGSRFSIRLSLATAAVLLAPLLGVYGFALRQPRSASGQIAADDDQNGDK